MAPPARTLWVSTSRSCQLRSKPVIGAHEVAGEHQVDEQLFADLERIELAGGHVHEGAGRADDQRGHAGEAGGDGVGEREAVEGRDVGGAEVAERAGRGWCSGVAVFVRRTRGSARRAWRGGRWCAFLLRRAVEGGGGRRHASPGMMPVSSCSVFMMVLSASRTSAAEAIALGGRFLQAAEDDGARARAGCCRGGGRVGELDGADGLELVRRRGGGRDGGRWRARRG